MSDKKKKKAAEGQCPMTRSHSTESTSKQSSCPENEGYVIPENVADLIKQLVVEEVQALSSSLEHSTAENTELKDRVISLEKRLKITEGLLVQMQTKMKIQNEKVLDLQTRSMRDNLVIRGVTEDSNES